MSGSIWRFLVAAVVSLFFLTGLVEIPLVVGSAGDRSWCLVFYQSCVLCDPSIMSLVWCSTDAITKN